MERILETAERAATAGGGVLSSYFRTALEVRNKAIADMVSEADVQSEQAIADVIRTAFPDHAIWGEEEAGSQDYSASWREQPHLWVVDPLDGTTNFVHQIPHFAVSIGYYQHGIGQAAVVLNPATSQRFHAVRGQGAWLSSPEYSEPVALRVNAETELDQTLVGVGFYYDRGELMQRTLAAVAEFFQANIHGIRRFGTASLDLCQVAAGRYGVFIEYILSPWDFAAGRIIVEEAGGRVTTCDGAPLPLQKSTLLASNGHLHDASLDITRRHL